MAGKFSIYKYCKINVSGRCDKAAVHANSKIRPDIVIVSGVEEERTE